MKIFYAVQASGNGHISRAMELLPFLKNYGEVDFFLSGNNSNLSLDAPIKYRSKGLSLYYNCMGSLSYGATLKKIQLLRMRKEINDLPVEKYDLIINDFDFITAAACAKKKVPSINFGHQASFQSNNTPRPDKKNLIGEWVLTNYIKSDKYVGLHFEQYDNFIFTPVVKKEILDAEPKDKKYILVYLPAFCQEQLKKILSKFTDYTFHIFCWDTKINFQEKNMHFFAINKKDFNQALINCSAIISGGGFETPSEAIHLGKKIMCIPIGGQYEQQCNVAALQKLGVTCLDKIDNTFETKFYHWINNALTIKKDFSKSIPLSLNFLFSDINKEFNSNKKMSKNFLQFFM